MNKPIDIQNFINTSNIDNRETYVVAALDQVNKGIAFVSSRRQRFIDLIESDNASTALVPVGGNPVAMALQEMSASEKRVWVIENENNRLYALDFIEGDAATFEFVDLSANREGIYTRAIFENSGRSIVETLNQAPDVQDFTVDNMSDCQSWEAEYNSRSNTYRIFSSLTGEQNARAAENMVYTSDDNQHQFIIEPGSLETTGGDKLTWFTCSASYIDLPGDAVDIHIIDQKAFILLNNSPSIEVFDLSLMTFDTSIPLPGALRVGKSSVQGNVWFIPDNDQAQLYQFDFDTQTVESIAVPQIMKASIAVAVDKLLLAPRGEERLFVYNTSSQVIEKEIFMDSLVLGLLDYSDTGQNRVLSYSRSGTVNAIDQSSLERIDFVNSRNGKESFVINSAEFFDQGPKSEPELIGLSTQDGVTLTESWQMVYEGTISNMVDVSATVSGSTLTVIDIDIIQTKLITGDRIVLSNGSVEESFLVESIPDSDTIILNANASFSGSVDFSASAVGSYVAIGSVSGEQSARVIRDQPYETDQEELAFLIRSSALLPASQGDFFSFRTSDGINSMDPADINLRSNITDACFFFNSIRNRYEAYLSQESTGRVLLINLDNNSLIKSII